MSDFYRIFPTPCPVIACIHLQPLPGAPRFESMHAVYQTALAEAEIYARQGVDGLIVENFHDAPFYPNAVPAETVAAMAAVVRELVRAHTFPIGVNVLRNDAHAALAIATACEAAFIRVNVHLGAVVADQGILQGQAHETLRLRRQLGSQALIFADAGVKHASPLAGRGLAAEAHELAERGKVDALVVSGAFTGAETSLADLRTVAEVAKLPILVGSGTTEANLPELFAHSQGLIVGSTFKRDGFVENPLDEARVASFMQRVQQLRVESFNFIQRDESVANHPPFETMTEP